MILRKNGIALKLATKDKRWWIKLTIAIILSNVLFFLFFHESEVQGADFTTNPNEVEIRIQANLFTPFLKGKKVLIINRELRISRPGILIEEHIEDEGHTYTIQVHEDLVNELLNSTQLQIIPFIKELKFRQDPTRHNYEVRY